MKKKKIIKISKKIQKIIVKVIHFDSVEILIKNNLDMKKNSTSDYFYI